MSSKRGRKRNDNLPPNRARDVQRAFRVRRAAHLHALEKRVAELEEENNCLRLALRLPLSTRPPLGKGPTGKNKIKTYENTNTRSLGLNSEYGSSDGRSPNSRASSIQSPSGISVSMSSSSHPMTAIDASWDESLLLNGHHQHPIQHTNDMQFSSDMSRSSMAVKPLQSHYPYNDTFASPSRSSSNPYSGTPVTYHNSFLGPNMGSSYGNQAFVQRDMREESHQQNPYSQSYIPSESASTHRQTPLPSLHIHSTHNILPGRESPLPYSSPHIHSVENPQAYSLVEGFPNLPKPTHPQKQPQSRSLDYIRPLDNRSMHVGEPSLSGPYSSNGRLNPRP